MVEGGVLRRVRREGPADELAPRERESGEGIEGRVFVARVAALVGGALVEVAVPA